MSFELIRRFRGCSFLAVACILLVGCGEPLRPDFEVAEGLHPVTGEVRFRDEIAPEATLRLHPSGGASGGPAITAVADAEGKFQVFTFQPEGKMLGAPAGQYKVTVSWVGVTQGFTQEKLDSLKELVAAKYQKPQTTPLTIEVVAGENQVGVIAVD
jgi:hypothetical protein